MLRKVLGLLALLAVPTATPTVAVAVILEQVGSTEWKFTWPPSAASDDLEGEASETSLLAAGAGSSNLIDGSVGGGSRAQVSATSAGEFVFAFGMGGGSVQLILEPSPGESIGDTVHLCFSATFDRSISNTGAGESFSFLGGAADGFVDVTTPGPSEAHQSDFAAAIGNASGAPIDPGSFGIDPNNPVEPPDPLGAARITVDPTGLNRDVFAFGPSFLSDGDDTIDRNGRFIARVGDAVLLHAVSASLAATGGIGSAGASSRISLSVSQCGVPAPAASNLGLVALGAVLFIVGGVSFLGRARRSA